MKIWGGVESTQVVVQEQQEARETEDEERKQGKEEDHTLKEKVNPIPQRAEVPEEKVVDKIVEPEDSSPLEERSKETQKIIEETKEASCALWLYDGALSRLEVCDKGSFNSDESTSSKSLIFLYVSLKSHNGSSYTAREVVDISPNGKGGLILTFKDNSGISKKTIVSAQAESKLKGLDHFVGQNLQNVCQILDLGRPNARYLDCPSSYSDDYDYRTNLWGKSNRFYVPAIQ